MATVSGLADPPMPALAAVLVVFGGGQAMMWAPPFARVLSEVPAAHAGSGAGVLSTVQQIGNASGVAVIGAIYFGLGQSGGPRIAVVICLVLLVAALAILAVLLRADRHPAAR